LLLEDVLAEHGQRLAEAVWPGGAGRDRVVTGGPGGLGEGGLDEPVLGLQLGDLAGEVTGERGEQAPLLHERVRAQDGVDAAGELRLPGYVAGLPGVADVADQGEDLLVLAGERVD
jgi:hypothetical protein